MAMLHKRTDCNSSVKPTSNKHRNLVENARCLSVVKAKCDKTLDVTSKLGVQTSYEIQNFENRFSCIALTNNRFPHFRKP